MLCHAILLTNKIDFKGNSEHFLWNFKPVGYPKHTTTSSWLPFPPAPFGLAGAVWKYFIWMVSHPQNNAVDSRHIVTAHYQVRKIWMLKIIPWEARLAEWKCRTRFGQKRALQSRQQRESRRGRICNQQTVTKNKTANAKKTQVKMEVYKRFWQYLPPPQSLEYH